MKILLLGELSGVHQELRRSLVGQGNEVVVGHSRMAYPGFESDIRFYRPNVGNENVWSWGREILSQLYHARRLAGFDVVQLMTPKFFNWKINEPMIRFMKRNNGALVVVNTSCTSDLHREWSGLEYSPCAGCKKLDLKSPSCRFDREDEMRFEHFVFDAADAIVATQFEYWWALRNTPFSAKLARIPLPVDLARHKPTPLPQTAAIRIWYGETRKGFKGGEVIGEALDRLQTSHGDKVEILRTSRLEFDDYLKLLDNVHIVIDQAATYSSGMHGLYALAHGRVTLTGAEPEAMDFAGASARGGPINIKPSADHIYDILVRLVEAPKTLQEIGRKSVEFVSASHDSDRIASAYVALYRTLLEDQPPSAKRRRPGPALPKAPPGCGAATVRSLP